MADSGRTLYGGSTSGPSLTAAIGDQTAALNAFLAAATPLGVKRLIGNFSVSGTLTVPASTYVDATRATITQTANNVSTLTLGSKATLFGGELVGKGTDYVAGTGNPTAIGVNVAGDNAAVQNARISNHAGAGIRLNGANGFRCSDTRIIGVSPGQTIPAVDSACFGVYILTATNSTFTGVEISDCSIGLISSIGCTHLTLQGIKVHDIPGQHGCYIQNSTGLVVDGVDAWSVNLNAVKLQMNSSSTLDAFGATVSNIAANDCGDCALSINNVSTDLTSATKYRGITVGNIAAYNCARAVYLGSIYGGTVTNVAGYSLTTDAVTIIDCQDLHVSNVSILGAGRRGILFNTQTGAVTQRVKISNAKIRNAANLNVASSQYGVHVSGNGSPDGVDLTFDGLEVTSTNGFMVYAFYNPAGDQATMTLRNVTLKNGITQDIRAIAGPVFFKELTNVRYSTSLNMPLQGQTNLAPALAVNNLAAETYDAVLKTLAQSAMTAGVLYVARLFVPQERTLSTIWYSLATSGATLTAGQNLIGVYDATGALIAQTGDQSTNFAAAAGDKSAALTAPVTVPAGSYLHIGVLWNGTTSPQFRGINGTSFPNTALTAAAQSRYATGGTGQTALPSTLPTLTAINAANSAPWFGIA
jgi:hypothetical protein